MTARTGPKAGSRTPAAKLGQRQQYRVTWRRWGWAPTTHDKSKAFGSWPAVQRFVRYSLYGDERPDLTGLVYVRVEVRVVGPWTEVEHDL